MDQVLLIESDQMVRTTVAQCSTALGVSLETLTKLPQAGASLWEQDWGLLLLSANVPEGDGLTWLRQVRAASRVPVILLVAAESEIDGILGLELGADVYLTKPLNQRHLLAQMRALLRRTRTNAYGLLPSPLLQFHQFELDEYAHVARCNGQRLELTVSEFELLRLLVREQGEVIARESLSQQLLGRPFSPTDRSLDVHVSNLRRKLSHVTRQPGHHCIRTIRGVGYALNAVQAINSI